ncbi:hypothetical protein CEP54_015594 [Fusarium duplospermum]|uniref:Sulfatase N-terminal domain-containing protein n=1 Tax=Fusarium duplospermum TaxID=1325734 RepID=A0A428NMY9_9HYPO|nr:hypothetical protein CEP54_015594 [Fusarium duplospermum]
MKFLAALTTILGSSLCVHGAKSKGRPNIVFIFTDDQDLLHGSTVFTNHYATVAVCCPSRVSLMCGQAAHNTNNTNIKAPAGGYPKFVLSGEGEDYLPHWLKKAGYNAECTRAPLACSNIGKLFNGSSLLNYSPGPQGWRHIDVLVASHQPRAGTFINSHNTVVMSENGGRPKHYRGFHQSDVVRIRTLSRLDKLLAEDDPFFLMIALTAPHVENRYDAPTAAARHLDTFANLIVPQRPDKNPADKFQKQKPAWLRGLEPLNSTQIDAIDILYQRRVEALQSVDYIITDVVKKLEAKGELDKTYIIYSTDQGVDSIDFAPTFLEIAGLAKKDQPSFLDGESLLKAWKNPHCHALAKKKEVINVEFWGNGWTQLKTWSGGDYASYFPGLYLENDDKTMRYVGEKASWMYSRWCTNDTVLYNTKDDPYELTNPADAMDPHIQRVKSGLNALLLVTKSYAEASCRDPWGVIQPPRQRQGKKVKTLDDAMDPAFDDFYSSFPLVNIEKCLTYQLAKNEGPFYPPKAEFGLGLKHRKSTGNLVSLDADPVKKLEKNNPLGGGLNHRH